MKVEISTDEINSSHRVGKPSKIKKKHNPRLLSLSCIMYGTEFLLI